VSQWEFVVALKKIILMEGSQKNALEGEKRLDKFLKRKWYMISGEISEC
jgi:hypothetical protein